MLFRLVEEKYAQIHPLKIWNIFSRYMIAIFDNAGADA